MSLKGTHKILEDVAGLPPVSTPARKRAAGGGRNVMLAVSVALGAAVVIAFSARAGKFEPAFLPAALVACVPALFHKFVVPERPSVKHGFLVAGFYLGLWGLWPVLYLYTMAKASWASVLFGVYGVAVFACFALGAFLPKWV